MLFDVIRSGFYENELQNVDIEYSSGEKQDLQKGKERQELEMLMAK